MIRVRCLVLDSCGRPSMRVVSRWHGVARFPDRVFHSPRVISAHVFRIVAFVCFVIRAFVVSSVCIVATATPCSDRVKSYCLRGYFVATCFRLFIVFRSGLFVVEIVRVFRKAFRRSLSW